MRTDNSDTQAASNVIDHPYEPPEGRPWDRCAHVYNPPNGKPKGLHGYAVCGLSQAVHKHVPKPYEPEATSYRCPTCVDLDIDPCEHQRGAES
jgi:hypothetical protein